MGCDLGRVFTPPLECGHGNSTLWLCVYTNLGFKGWHRAQHLVITHTHVFPSLPWLPPALGSAKTHLALSSVLKIAISHLAVSWCEHASLIAPLLPFLGSDAQCPARGQTHKLTCLSVLIGQGQRLKLLSRPVSPLPAPLALGQGHGT